MVISKLTGALSAVLASLALGVSLAACSSSTPATPVSTAPAALVKPAGCPQILSDLQAWSSTSSSDDISAATEFPSKVRADEAYAYPQLKSDEAILADDFDTELTVILSGDSSGTFDGAASDAQTVMTDCG